MRAQLSYTCSALVHASLFWALSVAGDVPQAPRFAVQAGSAGTMTARMGGLPAAPEPFDSRIDGEAQASVAVEALPTPTPAPTPADTEATSPEAAVLRTATPADLDERSLASIPSNSATGRRLTRNASTAEPFILQELPTRESIPQSGPLPAGPPVTVVSTPPEDTAGVAAPERLVAALPGGPRAPAVAAEVIEAGNAEFNSLGSAGQPGAQVDQFPQRLPANPQPPYPDELRRQLIGGTVLLRLVVGPDGTVASIRVERSSGHPALDESALSTVRKWRFVPARRGNQAVSYEFRLPIEFGIRGTRRS